MIPALAVPPSFDERRYLPVVLTRQGERLAMRELAADVRQAMTPLFVVHPIDTDPRTGEPKRTLAEHLGKLAEALPRDWGVGPAFVDLRFLETEGVGHSPRGATPLGMFLAACLERGLALAPTISPDHSDAYRAAAVQAADELGLSPCLRLGPREWHDIGTPFGDGRLLGLVAETHRKATDLHLVFDLQDQIAATPELTAAAIRPALRALPQALDWLSVTVAGTGMPTGTAEIGADGQANIPRVEWQLWRLLTDPETRRVSFGDYCVQHPNPLSDFNPLFMDSSAQLRYTIPDSWFVARGRGVRARGAEQIHQLAGLVVSHADFSGADFSCGDNWLARCAARECGAGNQGVWRKVTTSHHLTYVVRQIANHFGS